MVLRHSLFLCKKAHSFKKVCAVLLILLSQALSISVVRPDNFRKSEQKPLLPRLIFEPNRGQIFDLNGHKRPDILVRVKSATYLMDVAQWGLAYYLIHEESESRHSQIEKRPGGGNHPIRYRMHRVELRWLGGQAEESGIHYVNPVGALTHYYNVPAGSLPVLNVPSYEEVFISEVYPGISLHLRKNAGGILESDWLLTEAKSSENLILECRGATPQTNEKGELVLRTPLGEIREAAPVAIQEGRKVPCSWKVNGSIVKLELNEFEPHKPVIIDPPVRIWGSFFGGSGIESIYHSTTDAQGGLIVTGYTLSVAQIATSGAFQTVFGGTAGGGPGAYYAGGDAFVARFSSDGQLLWATYLGGAADEEAFGCTVNASGEIYVVGHTASTSGIATPGTYQDSLKGQADMFIIKLSNSGIRLWGSYLGGAEEDIAWACTTDPVGNLFIVGQTKSASNIGTLGAHQHLPGGNTDAVVARFSSNGQLMWASYLGGAAQDMAYGCTADAYGNVYFVGRTFSTNNMVSFGAHQTAYGGAGDAFVAKFNATGSRLWSSYLGGSGPDVAFGCHFANGRLVVSGYTNSPSGIATSGTHRSQLIGADAFLVMFNSNGQRLWGTYLGGSNEDYALSCQFTPDHKILVGGYTNSPDSLSTNDAFQPFYMGGYDGFWCWFDTVGQRIYATYYGGMSDEYDCRTVQSLQGNIYLTGQTGSAFDGTISTPLAYQSFFGGGLYDGFVVQFLTCANLVAQASATPPVVCVGTHVQLTALPNGANAYQWYGPAGFISTAQNPIIPNIQATQSGYYHVIVDFSNQCADTLYDSVWVSVLPVPAKPTVADTTIFIGQQALLVAQQPPGHQTYWYITPTGGSPIFTGPVFLTPQLYQTTSYYAEFQVGSCASPRDTVKITVIDNTGLLEPENGALVVYPQPASDVLYVSWPDNLQEAVINCYTLQGSLVGAFKVSPQSPAILSVRDFTSGVYILELKSAGRLWRSRFVVMR